VLQIVLRCSLLLLNLNANNALVTQMKNKKG